MNVRIFIYGGLGIFAFPSYIDPATGDATSMMWAAIAVVVSMVVAFLLTFFTYKDDQKVNEEELADTGFEKTAEEIADKKAAAAASHPEVEEIVAPLKGKKINLSDVKDEVFSTGLMGQGLAIVPEVGELYAPADGEISTFFPTGHAIGMKLDSGPEILMHVGMDTVELNGKHFEPQKQQGDHVKKGDLLLKFDIEGIKNDGYIVDTPILVVDAGEYDTITPFGPGDVETGETVIELS